MSPEPSSASETMSVDPSLLSDADTERGDWAERVIAAVAAVVGVLVVAAIAVVIGVA